jgi:hypothetical protein
MVSAHYRVLFFLNAEYPSVLDLYCVAMYFIHYQLHSKTTFVYRVRDISINVPNFEVNIHLI